MNQENVTLVKELRKVLHQCPELAGQEFQTKCTIIQFLQQYTELRIVDKGKWFYVVYEENASETIGFRADMDAVHTPDGKVKHACGHDGHSATLAGLILEVSDQSKRGFRFGKNICFIFQYGEETGEGGRICCEVIGEAKIGTIYAYHNIPGFLKGAVIIKKNAFACASKGMILHFSGSPTHAAYPEYGRNPSISIGAFLSKLPAVTNPALYQGMILCTIVGVQVGSEAFGVAASEGKVMLTIRGEHESDILKLQENLHNKAKYLSNKEKLSLNASYCDEFTETINDNDCLNVIIEKLNHKNIPIIEPKEPFRWSEDFGHYLKLCKGAMIGIGDGEEYGQLHTAEYEFPDDILEKAVDIFYAII